MLGKVKCEETKNMTLTGQSSGELGLFIKFYHFHNTAGNPGPPVYYIANDDMESDQFVAAKVNFMGNTSDINGFGYLCMGKTRAGNVAFYRWFATMVVVPFVNTCRLSIEDETTRAFVTCDGEAKQIEVFQCQDMLSLLASAKIDFGKTPASCSGACQSSDVSPLFQGCKKKTVNFKQLGFRGRISSAQSSF